MGDSWACLSSVGTELVERDRLMMEVRMGIADPKDLGRDGVEGAQPDREGSNKIRDILSCQGENS